LRRIVTFYNPGNPVAQRSASFARDAARQLKVQLVVRPFQPLQEIAPVASDHNDDSAATPFLAIEPLGAVATDAVRGIQESRGEMTPMDRPHQTQMRTATSLREGRYGRARRP